MVAISLEVVESTPLPPQKKPPRNNFGLFFRQTSDPGNQKTRIQECKSFVWQKQKVNGSWAWSDSLDRFFFPRRFIFDRNDVVRFFAVFFAMIENGGECFCCIKRVMENSTGIIQNSLFVSGEKGCIFFFEEVSGSLGEKKFLEKSVSSSLLLTWPLEKNRSPLKTRNHPEKIRSPLARLSTLFWDKMRRLSLRLKPSLELLN